MNMILISWASLSTYVNVIPPMYVPRKSDVFKVAAVGSIAIAGKSCMYVARHVRTAAIPTKLKIIVKVNFLFL